MSPELAMLTQHDVSIISAQFQHNYVGMIKSAQYLSCYGPTSLIFIQLFCCKSQPLTASRTPYIHLSIWITHQFGWVFQKKKFVKSSKYYYFLNYRFWIDFPVIGLEHLSKFSNSLLDEFSRNRSESCSGKLPILAYHCSNSYLLEPGLRLVSFQMVENVTLSK